MFQGLNKRKRVHFKLDPEIYNEPNNKEICDLLKEARISDWPRRHIKKLHMEQLLRPIFTIEHRQKVQQYNFLSDKF